MFTSSYSADPVASWPLFFDSPNFETLSATGGGKLGCSLTEGAVHPDLMYKSVIFNGNPRSYLEMNIASGLVPGDFAISVGVNLADMGSGTIFHYLESPNITDPAIRISEIIFWHNAFFGHVEVYEPGHKLIGTLTVTFPFEIGDDATEWVNVGLSYDFSKPEIKLLSSEGDELGKADLDSDKPKLSLPGVLRIGAAINNLSYPCFEGQMICLSLFDAKAGPAEIPKFLDYCDMSIWNASLLSSTGNVFVRVVMSFLLSLCLSIYKRKCALG